MLAASVVATNLHQFPLAGTQCPGDIVVALEQGLGHDERVLRVLVRRRVPGNPRRVGCRIVLNLLPQRPDSRTPVSPPDCLDLDERCDLRQVGLEFSALGPECIFLRVRLAALLPSCHVTVSARPVAHLDRRMAPHALVAGNHRCDTGRRDPAGSADRRDAFPARCPW